MRFTGELDWKRERRLRPFWRQRLKEGRGLESRGDSFDDCFNPIIPLAKITRISKYCIIFSYYFNSFDHVSSVVCFYPYNKRVVEDKILFPRHFSSRFKGRNTLIALTRVICLNVPPCASQIFEICPVYTQERRGGEKGRRVV